MSESLPRSCLYVPGNAAEKLNKALARSADALIIDLEDAVPPSEKEAARSQVVDWLRSLPAEPRIEIWVRTNSGSLLMEDVKALAGIPSLTGMVLAKCEGQGDTVAVDQVLTGLGDRRTLLMPLIETAGAVLDARRIAEGPRVRQLQIGEVDLAAELGMTPSPDDEELSSIRSMIVLVSAAAGISPPLGPVSRITQDLAALAESTRRLHRQGFSGRACIHPAQIPVVHDVFTPSADDIAEARLVIDLSASAEAEGRGVVLHPDGRLIDPAVLRSAWRTLALAARVDAVTDAAA